MLTDRKFVPSDAFLQLKVNALKEVCLASGLSRQGRKADLQQRILNAMKHGGRVQHALERLLPNQAPLSQAAAGSTDHSSRAPLNQAGTAKLRCPCGAQRRFVGERLVCWHVFCTTLSSHGVTSRVCCCCISGGPGVSPRRKAGKSVQRVHRCGTRCTTCGHEKPGQ